MEEYVVLNETIADLISRLVYLVQRLRSKLNIDFCAILNRWF